MILKFIVFQSKYIMISTIIVLFLLFTNMVWKYTLRKEVLFSSTCFWSGTQIFMTYFCITNNIKFRSFFKNMTTGFCCSHYWFRILTKDINLCVNGSIESQLSDGILVCYVMSVINISDLHSLVIGWGQNPKVEGKMWMQPYKWPAHKNKQF